MGFDFHRKQRWPQSTLGRRPAEDRCQAICGPGSHLDERLALHLGARAVPPASSTNAGGTPALPGLPCRYAAAATLPLKVRPNFVAETATLSPSLTRPDRINSASGSCKYFWITRLSGRAP